MINKSILVGRLTRDPEIRATTSGTSVCAFSIAVDNRVARGAERSASFINCVCFNNTAELLVRYQKKGALIGVEGRLQSRTYLNKDGQKVYVLEVLCESITFLETKNSSANRNEFSQTNNNDMSASYNADYDNGDSIDYDLSDDDLPF